MRLQPAGQHGRFIVTVFLVLFCAPVLLQFVITAGADNEAYGFPLPFLQKTSYQCVMGGDCPPPHFEFMGVSLVTDVVVVFLLTLFTLYLVAHPFVQGLGRLMQVCFVSSALFILCTLISIVFSVGYPMMKTLTSIGLPIAFLAMDPGGGPSFGSLFLGTFLALDIAFWLAMAVVILSAHGRFILKTRN